MTIVAVIDIGKTNAKVVLVEAETRSELAIQTRPNTVINKPPYPHFDLDGLFQFIVESLKVLNAIQAIDAVSITTHGASIVLLDVDGNLACPMLDYESDKPDERRAAYDVIRPAFAETGSPGLPGGLNVGAQLYWLFEEDPTLKDRTDTILCYPQYWSFRLCGIRANEVSSLGCHTDLWNPSARNYSSLVDHLAIRNKLAPIFPADAAMGPVLPAIAAETGLDDNVQIYCGIHDSNASLLPYILTGDPPYSVVSTGTWTVVMTMGGDELPLDPKRDTLINVNAHGAPVHSARFMGGREFDLMTGGVAGTLKSDAMQEVLSKKLMLMPAVVPDTGPFQGRTSQWIGDEPSENSESRAIATAFYLALVTTECLSLTGHKGQVIVEGPFSKNTPYLAMLCSAAGCEVRLAENQTGTSIGAALLVTGDAASIATKPISISDDMRRSLSHYADGWRHALAYT